MIDPNENVPFKESIILLLCYFLVIFLGGYFLHHCDDNREEINYEKK